MKYTLDLDKPASSALVRSKTSTISESVLPSFWADNITLELDFVEPASWVGDAGAVVKARIGLLPSTYLVEPVTGSWDGKQYIFNLDFNNESFNTAIITKLQLAGFFELQVEYGGNSRTILQQKATFRNSFLDASPVALTLPDEPSFLDSEIISPPLEPSIPVAISSPKSPVSVQINFRPSNPQEVKSGNQSIIPLAPNQPVVEVKRFPPNNPNDIKGKIFGMPDAPSLLETNLVLPKPLAPKRFTAVLVDVPVIENVYAYEVVPNSKHNDYHKYIFLNIEGKVTNYIEGELVNVPQKPFVLGGLDKDGSPTYYRETPVPIYDRKRNELETNYEYIKIVKRYNNYAHTLRNDVVTKWKEDALLYNPEGYDYVSKYRGYRPKNLPEDLSKFDTSLYFVQVLLAYNYERNSSNTIAPNTLYFEGQVNAIFVNEEQKNKLGTRSYGGQKISYVDTPILEVSSPFDTYTFQEYAEATFNIQPAFSPLVALKPEAVTNIDASEILNISGLPSNINANIKDFQPARYSPVVWLDASQETAQEETALSKLSNFAGTMYEVQHSPSQQVESGSEAKFTTFENYPAYDFSSTRSSYVIPQNVFGEHFDEAGSEVEIIMAYMPLSYDSSSDDINLRNDGSYRPYSPHVFVNGKEEANESYDQRFTAHAPWGDGRLYFDAGRLVPSVTARVSSGNNLQDLNKRAILSLRSSTRNDESVITLNGTEVGRVSGVAEKIFMSDLKLGGWGRSPFGQSMMVHEVLIFRNKLEPSQREKIEGYLAHKWGVNNELPNTHISKEIPPSNLGESRLLDPFPKKPFVRAGAYPKDPSNPSAGIGCFPPSEIFAGNLPNNPSTPLAEPIPLLRFRLDGLETIHNINLLAKNTTIGRELEKLEGILERIEIHNTAGDIEPVTFSVTDNTTNTFITPALESVQDGKITGFSFNRQEYKPYLSVGEKSNIDVRIRVEDSSGNVNTLFINVSITGSAGQYGVELQSLSEGELAGQTIELGYPALERDGSTTNTQVPHYKDTPLTFDIKITTPDKSGAKLYAYARNQGYLGQAWRGSYLRTSKLDYTFYEVTNGMDFQIPKRFFDQITKYDFPSRYHSRMQLMFDRWQERGADTLPIKLKCVNVTESIPDVEKTYSIEVEYLVEAGDTAGTEGKLNSLHAMQSGYHPYFTGSRGGYVGVTQENLRTLPTLGFNLGFTPYNGVVNKAGLNVYPVSYNVAKPSNVRSYNGRKVWGNPSNVELKVQHPKFPVDNLIGVDAKPMILTANEYRNQWSTQDKFHYVDPENRFIGYDENSLPVRTQQGLVGTELARSWVWGFNFYSPAQRMAHTYVHYTELSNIKVDNITRTRPQEVWKYPFEWHLVDGDGKPTTGKGFLDPVTLRRLESRQEKLITLPSGKQISTEFGGYVQTSKSYKIRLHPVTPATYSYYNGAYHLNQPNKFHKDDYYEYNLEPNNLGKIKPKLLAHYENERYYRELPHLATPIEIKYDFKGALPIPQTGHLSRHYARMAGLATDEYTGVITNNRFTPDALDIYKEFDSLNDAEFFFHTESKIHYESSFHQKYHQTLPIHGQDLGTPSFRNLKDDLMLSIHIEPTDVQDSSVHPKWGRAYTRYYWIERLSSSTATAREVNVNNVDFPQLPSAVNLSSESEGTKILNQKEFAFIEQNKPATPQFNNMVWRATLSSTKENPYLFDQQSNVETFGAKKTYTWKDLVPHTEYSHQDLIDNAGDFDWSKSTRENPIFVIIPKDEQIINRYADPNNWVAGEGVGYVKAGDIYYFTYAYSLCLGYHGCKEEHYWGLFTKQWLTWEEGDGDNYITLTNGGFKGTLTRKVSDPNILRPDFNHPIFKNLYMLRPTDGFTYIDNFIIDRPVEVKDTWSEYGYNTFLNHIEGKYLVASNKFTERDGIEQGDIIKFVRSKRYYWRGDPRVVLYYRRDAVGTSFDANFRGMKEGAIDFRLNDWFLYFTDEVYDKVYVRPETPKLLAVYSTTNGVTNNWINPN